MDNEKTIQYKNYYTIIHFEPDENIYTGKIEGISDLVIFEADNLHEAEEEFKSAVDDYLIFCGEINKKPELPLDDVIHKRLA